MTSEVRTVGTPEEGGAGGACGGVPGCCHVLFLKPGAGCKGLFHSGKFVRAAHLGLADFSCNRYILK